MNMRAILVVTSSLLEGEETTTDGVTESDSASDEIDL